MSATWDVFHADQGGTERGLSTEAVRQGLASGSIREDDLIRPTGSTFGWAPILDLAEFQPPVALPVDPSAGAAYVAEFADPFEDDSDQVPRASVDSDSQLVALEGVESGEAIPQDAPPPLSAEFVDDDLLLGDAPPPPPSFEFIDDLEPEPEQASAPILPPVPRNPVPPWDEQAEFEDDDVFDPLDEDEEAAEFTLSRSGPETIEELDLAAMVDVAFQLVLFFLVTATTVLYKSLEVPKPNNDAPPEAAVQGRGKTLDDMKANFILVEIAPTGAIKLDHEPLPDGITLDALADKLRTARKDTDRSAMLLSADFSTPHRSAVLAYDAANEIGLRIAIAKPTGTAPVEGGNNPPPPIRKNAGGGF